MNQRNQLLRSSLKMFPMRMNSSLHLQLFRKEMKIDRMTMLIINIRLIRHLHLPVMHQGEVMRDLEGQGDRGKSRPKKGTYTLLAHLQIQIAEENCLKEAR
jgi:hypothetical protein